MDGRDEDPYHKGLKAAFLGLAQLGRKVVIRLGLVLGWSCPVVVTCAG